VGTAIVSGPRGCRLLGNLDPRSVGPEPFQVVELPGLVVEEVDDEVPIVEQYPLAVLDTLTAQHPLRLQLGLDLVHQAAQMGARRAGGDDEQVGEDEEVGNVQDGGLFTLLLDDGGNRLPCGFDGLVVGCDVRSSLIQLGSGYT
jgi:hypothetical protein